eukprot:TRINITY_DN56972_c0_g1_i1.p1 TRINITY_DN56972_c0_g1~~TRINITY_DN56972_c0_g1_i1.p1  ORF type:complete len:383 (-),score=48.37 TRINITY_DN56972_c0_g1_i1:193-1341(-)
MPEIPEGEVRTLAMPKASTRKAVLSQGICFEITVSCDMRITRFVGYCQGLSKRKMYLRHWDCAEGSQWSTVFSGIVKPSADHICDKTGYKLHELSLPVQLDLKAGSHAISFHGEHYNTVNFSGCNADGAVKIFRKSAVALLCSAQSIGSEYIRDDVLNIRTGFSVTSRPQRASHLNYNELRAQVEAEAEGNAEPCGRVFLGALEYQAICTKNCDVVHLDRITSAMRDDDDFVDVAIQCGGEHFKAHRVMLACASSVFAALLKTNMAEARHGKIVIDNFNPNVIAAALQFIYKGILPSDVDDDMMHIIRFADMYNIAGLVKAAGDRILRGLNAENVADVVRALNPHKRCPDDDSSTEASQLSRRVRRAVMSDCSLMGSCLDDL